VKIIECPDCHSENWSIIQTPQGKRNKETVCAIREDTIPMVQSDYIIIQTICNECKIFFWIPETQAEIIMEEFA
jgi:hypothetical protein